MILHNPTYSSNKSIVRIIIEEIVNIFYYYFHICHSRYFVMYFQITVNTECVSLNQAKSKVQNFKDYN